jgi:hypothetical protein
MVLSTISLYFTALDPTDFKWNPEMNSNKCVTESFLYLLAAPQNEFAYCIVLTRSHNHQLKPWA